MMFIGDSLQRGQFESMICLVQSVIPEGKKSLQRIPPMKIFRVEVHKNASFICIFQNNIHAFINNLVTAYV